MNKSIPFRSWYYFRTGYTQYFSFILAVLNMYTLTYYLAIEDSSTISTIFSSFSTYVIVSSLIGIPSLVILGFLHMRRSGAFRAESEITSESNPYNYKLLPGIHKEALAPLLLEMLKLSRKSTGEEITEEENERLSELDKKLVLLAKGGMLDIPKKFEGL